MLKSFSVALMCLLGLQLSAQKLPAFSFTGLDGQTFTHAQLQPGLPTIAIFFDPYCDHCATQAGWIVEAADLFQDVQMIWVTTESAEAATEFYNTHFKDSGLDKVYVLLDPEFMFDSYFGYSEVPSIYLYDAAGKRIKALHEETEAAKLKAYFDKKR